MGRDRWESFFAETWPGLPSAKRVQWLSELATQARDPHEQSRLVGEGLHHRLISSVLAGIGAHDELRLEQAQAARCLANLSYQQPNKVAVAQAGGLQALEALLRAQMETQWKAFLNKGGEAAAAARAEDASAALLLEVVAAIANLVTSERVSAYGSGEGAGLARLLVDATRLWPGSAETSQVDERCAVASEAARGLKNMACDPSMHARLLEANALDALELVIATACDAEREVLIRDDAPAQDWYLASSDAVELLRAPAATDVIGLDWDIRTAAPSVPAQDEGAHRVLLSRALDAHACLACSEARNVPRGGARRQHALARTLVSLLRHGGDADELQLRARALRSWTKLVQLHAVTVDDLVRAGLAPVLIGRLRGVGPHHNLVDESGDEILRMCELLCCMVDHGGRGRDALLASSWAAPLLLALHAAWSRAVAAAARPEACHVADSSSTRARNGESALVKQLAATASLLVSWQPGLYTRIHVALEGALWAESDAERVAASLSQLALAPTACREAARGGLIPRCVGLIGEARSARTQLVLLRALCHVVDSARELSVPIALAGAIPALIQLRSNGGPDDVRDGAASLLCLMACHGELLVHCLQHRVRRAPSARPFPLSTRPHL